MNASFRHRARPDRRTRISLAAGAGLLCMLGGAFQAQAADARFAVGTITVETPWTRATPGGAKVGGAYMTITNTGDSADRLVGGSLPVAERVEIHSMSVEAGIMRMAPVEGGLEIPAGGSVSLEPGGYHVMFMGLREGLRAGETIAGTLLFEKAGPLDIVYAIGPIGSRTAPADHASSRGDHGHDAQVHDTHVHGGGHGGHRH